ncbi:1516_t:CDS:2, partial [Ambispora gerdemannii]
QYSKMERARLAIELPNCFCNVPASSVYSEEFGLLYECHYRHANPWQKVVDQQIRESNHDCSNKGEEGAKVEADSSSILHTCSLSSGCSNGICGFHVHKKPWDKIWDRLTRTGHVFSHDEELSICPFFNFTYCELQKKAANSCSVVPIITSVAPDQSVLGISNDSSLVDQISVAINNEPVFDREQAATSSSNINKLNSKVDQKQSENDFDGNSIFMEPQSIILASYNTFSQTTPAFINKELQFHTFDKYEQLVAENEKLRKAINELESKILALQDKFDDVNRHESQIDQENRLLRKHCSQILNIKEVEQRLRQSCQKKNDELATDIQEFKEKIATLRQQVESLQEENLNSNVKCRVCYAGTITHAILP